MTDLNPIVLENLKQGTPESEWRLTRPGDSNIEGFATNISVNVGGTVDLKINTDATEYRIDIYRLGYYGGDGARKIATILHDNSEPFNQPEPLVDKSRGLVDAGNWSVTDSFTLPPDAISGVYIARLSRVDGVEGENVIPFIVRDDGGTSHIIFQTSDQTWQAYNQWGGHSLYDGKSVAVSYNRPIQTPDGPDVSTASGPWNFVFGAEYSAIRWLEENGYDVAYMSGVDTSRSGELLLNHKAFLSVGHDEYWSGEQRAYVEAARNAGVNLNFWSGNEIYWKTEFLASIDGTDTPYRTLVSYKTSSTLIDNPSGIWTGTWRDPSIGMPENALTGTLYMVDWDHENPIHIIAVPSDYADLRFWRGTSIAALQDGESYQMNGPYLGYEWDVNAANGFQPGGLINLSSTTVETNAINTIFNLAQYVLPDPPGTATHNLTMYRAESGALVFGAGTVFWSWALNSHHAPGPDGFGAGAAADLNVQQAMVNLFADQGIQPVSLRSDLIRALQSMDFIAPSTQVTTDISGVFEAGQAVTISGTATDVGGVVAGVEVSVDGGSKWHAASGKATWSYTFTPAETSALTIMVRATDDSLNLEQPKLGVGLAVTDFHNDFSVAQGWSSTTTPRMLVDINGDGRQDLIGFGNSAIFGVLGMDDSAQYLGGPSFTGGTFNVRIADFGIDQGYANTKLRNVDFLGNFTDEPGARFASVWAQGPDGLRYYVATDSTTITDVGGGTYQVPVFETTPRLYTDFSATQGWTDRHTIDVGFLSNTNAFASVIGFGELGILIGDQVFDQSKAANPVYSAKGSEAFGNEAGWDSTIDIRAVRDCSGNVIDLNGDGIMDVIGMGPDGLVYAFGQYNPTPPSGEHAYSLGAVHLADIGASGGGSDFGRAQNWTLDNSVREIADINNDGHVDIIGFGDYGIFVAMGKTPSADGTGAFERAYLAYDDMGTDQGWLNSDHVRVLGDMNGDGLLDIVAFGQINTFIATGGIDPVTNRFSWTWTNTFQAYALEEGFKVDENFRTVGDVNGDGIADIVVSGASNTQILSSVSQHLI